MSYALKNPYGLRNGIIVTPDIVERGLACGCICPACSGLLIANHPKENKQEYFSHQSGRECEAAYQTVLHLLAKEVLAEEKQILLPPLSVMLQDHFLSDVKSKMRVLKSRLVNIPAEFCNLIIPEKITIVREGHYQSFHQVDVEESLGQIIPDVVMQVNNRRLLVEIFLTHPATEEKRRWLEENDLPMIEFDFSATDRTVTRDELKKAFLQLGRPLGNGGARWIHHPKAQETRRKMDSEFQATYLDRIEDLLRASDPAVQAACNHEYVEILGDDGVRRCLCQKCWKFYGLFRSSLIT
jgi:hypothetical protein